MMSSLTSGVLKIGGELAKTYEEARIEWGIPEFSFASEFMLQSPAFSFVNDFWVLKFYWRGSEFPLASCFVGIVHLKRVSDGPPKSVNYTFCVKDKDGTVKNVTSASSVFQHDCMEHRVSTFTQTSEWVSEMFGSCSSGFFQILFLLQHDIPQTAHHMDHLTKLTDLETLSSNLNDLLLNGSSCDATLKVKGQEFHAHKSLLIARSPVFAATFEHDMSEKVTGVVTIPDCDVDSFGDFLQYLYTGKIEKMSFRTAFHLYSTSDKYDVNELKRFCSRYMGYHLTAENVSDVVMLADRYYDTQLLSTAQEFFNDNVRDIVVTTEWETLMNANYRLANKLIVEMASKMKIQR